MSFVIHHSSFYKTNFVRRLPVAADALFILLQTRGIILRTIKYGETSVISDIFTLDKGVCTFIGGGVRTPKSRMPHGLFQPMTVVDLVSYYRDDPNALNRLKEVKAGEVWQAIPFDLKRGAVALFLAEVCRKSLMTGDAHEELFYYMIELLRHLDETKHPISALHLHFLTHLASFLGLQPEAPEEEGEWFFDFKEGTYTSVPPVHTQYFTPTDLEYLWMLLAVDVRDCHELPLDRPVRKMLMLKILDYFRVHMPSFGTLNTPEVLETVF